MAERDVLITRFDDCIERMHAGASLEDCLRLYPNEADALRPLLVTAQQVRRAAVSSGEAAQAQMSTRFRFEAALQQPTLRTRRPLAALRTLAAAIALILFGGVLMLFVAQSALPGDPLYGLKRAGEQTLLSLAGGQDDGQLNERRITEIRALLAAGRTAEVRFEGEIQAQVGENWLINSLPVVVAAETPGAAAAGVGDRVRVDGFTTPNQQFIASEITLIERGPAPTPTLDAATAAPTASPLPLPTSTASASPIPAATAVPSMTSSPTAAPTATPSRTSSRTPTRTPAPTLTPTLTATTPPAPLAGCTPQAPMDWVRYAVRPGDTLSGLAVTTGAAVEQLRTVNCLDPSSLLIVNQALFLPRLPPSPTVATAEGPAPVATDDHADDDSGGDDSSHDSGDDDDHSGSGNSGRGSDD
jgi:LysM repeat protein